MTVIPTSYQGSVTATSDLPFKLVTKDVWVETVDIFVLDNNAYMGDMHDQAAPILTNDLYYSLVPVNLNDFYFKNLTAGSNTRIVFQATLLTDIRKKLLGIPLG
jgi:hypothetical protein